MYHHNKRKGIHAGRIGSMLLAFIMTVSMVPLFAFADEGSVITEDAGTETAAVTEVEQLPYSEPEIEMPDQDTLLGQYIENETGVEITGPESAADQGEVTAPQVMMKKARRSLKLTDTELAVYNELLAGVRKIAAGEAGEIAYVKITTYKKECDLALIFYTLLAENPYELYWFDKTEGAYPVAYLNPETGKKENRFYFTIAESYRQKDASGKDILVEILNNGHHVYKLNSEPERINSALANAEEIVQAGKSGASELETLKFYRDEICRWTDYNFAALNGGQAYGDPWQIIYVFDSVGEGDGKKPDLTTKVVCEGYAKAFKFLCDKTGFEGIDCYLASGKIFGRNHMWNILTMDDGGNYLADLTNYDSGATGIFLNKAEGWIATGYVCGGYRYIYNNETLRLYNEQELSLSDTDYTGTVPAAKYHAAKAVTCESAGNAEYWSRLGICYEDEECSNAVSQNKIYMPATGHLWSSWKTVKEPDCTAKGLQERTCAGCGIKESRTDTVPARGHKYEKISKLDEYVYKCGRCGHTYTKSKVVVDLPKVTIKKPSKARKAFTVRWKKLSSSKRRRITGIEIQYSRSGKFTARTSDIVKAGKNSVSKKIRNLDQKQKYYIRIRTYRYINGKKHVSKWSSVKTVRTK